MSEDVSFYQAAIVGYREQRRQIDAKIGELQALVERKQPKTATVEQPSKHRNRRGRRISAAGRERIAAAQRRRWAKQRRAA